MRHSLVLTMMWLRKVLVSYENMFILYNPSPASSGPHCRLLVLGIRGCKHGVGTAAGLLVANNLFSSFMEHVHHSRHQLYAKERIAGMMVMLKYGGHACMCSGNDTLSLEFEGVEDVVMLICG